MECATIGGMRSIFIFACLIFLFGCDSQFAQGSRGGQTGAGPATGSPAGTGGGGGGTGMVPITGANKFGIGLTTTGGDSEFSQTLDLTGAGGHVKMIFAGVHKGKTSADGGWKDAVAGAFAKNLVPVIRIQPSFGDLNIRKDADGGSNHRRYTELAQAYKSVVGDIGVPNGKVIWYEIHNEPNLCYEWLAENATLSYTQTAAEYAGFLRDVADAIHSLGNPNIRVINGGLAPGGATSCTFSGGAETGFASDLVDGKPASLAFLRAMVAEVPDLASKLDGFASHSYPATDGQGASCFYQAMPAATLGLNYYKGELAIIGNKPVLMTETGWCRKGGTCDEKAGPCAPGLGNDGQVADWTVAAYQQVWLKDPNVHAVMPFILRDGGQWDPFGWADGSGNPRDVFNKVKALRCQTIGGC